MGPDADSLLRMSLELLRGARQAQSEGLITNSDYDMIKTGFLRAQQIKAGLDAGFIRQEDYDKARDAYLASLDFIVMATRPSAGGPSPPPQRERPAGGGERGAAGPPPPRGLMPAPAPAPATPAASGSGGGGGGAPSNRPLGTSFAGGAGAASGGGWAPPPRERDPQAPPPAQQPPRHASASPSPGGGPPPAAPRPASASAVGPANGGGHHDAHMPQPGAVSRSRSVFGTAGGYSPRAPSPRTSDGGGGGSAPFGFRAPSPAGMGAAPPAHAHAHAHAPAPGGFRAANGGSSAGGGAPYGPRATISGGGGGGGGTISGKCSMAGIGLHEDCVKLFMSMKTRSMFKWITYRVDDSGKSVIPDRYGSKDSPYEEFLATLPPNECRYGVYDFEYVSPERGSFSKIVFVNWAPETAAVKNKMMYAATKDFVKGFMEGMGAELQASEPSEVTEEELRQKVVANLSRK